MDMSLVLSRRSVSSGLRTFGAGCGDVVEDQDLISAPHVQSVDQDFLPTMVHPFFSDRFLVRNAYISYYERILGFLTKRSYISLTGTPGIGKSIFYIYCSQRYRCENPNMTIVTASFSDNRELEVCAIFRPGQPVEYQTIIPRIPGSIHFYDGTPPRVPHGAQMVCFTSPNDDWLKFMLNKFPSNHVTLFLPLWSRAELHSANRELGLGIESGELDRRFNVFGGVARICLATDAINVETIEAELEDECNRVITSLTSSMDNAEHEIDSSLYEMIIHLVPHGSDGEDSARFASFKIASPTVFELLARGIPGWADLEDERRIPYLMSMN